MGESLFYIIAIVFVGSVICGFFKEKKPEQQNTDTVKVVYFSTDPRYNYISDIVQVLNSMKNDHDKVLYLMSIMPQEKVDHMLETLDVVDRVAKIVQPQVKLIR